MKLVIDCRVASLASTPGLSTMAVATISVNARPGSGTPTEAHIVNVRVLGNDLVQLTGEDLHTADADHVLETVDDKEETVLVHGGDVAGMHVAVADGVGRLLGFVMVASHDLRAAGAQLARLSQLGNLAGGRVNQLDIGIRKRQAHGADFLFAQEGLGCYQRAGLGHAVDLDQLVVSHDLIELLDQLGREGRCTADVELDEGEVHLLEVLVLHHLHEEGGDVGHNWWACTS